MSTQYTSSRLPARANYLVPFCEFSLCIMSSFCHCYVVCKIVSYETIISLRPKQNGHHFVDSIFKSIFLFEICCILNKILLLTLNVRGPSYLGLTMPISWLLMPWLLASPGHQQPWYWLFGICRSFSYLRMCFKYLCQINVEEWHKIQIYVYIPSEKFSI